MSVVGHRYGERVLYSRGGGKLKETDKTQYQVSVGKCMQLNEAYQYSNCECRK
jgi:hypothetical protein